MSRKIKQLDRSQHIPGTGKCLSVLSLVMLFLSGCAGQPQRSATALPEAAITAPIEQTSAQTPEISYPEYVFRRQNDVIDRSMFLVDENPQISDQIYQDIRLREESLYEACRYLNEMALIRSQQEEESWYLLVKTLFSLGQCEAAANELENYLLNIKTEDPDAALGAL